MQDRLNAGRDIFVYCTGRIQDRTDAGQDGFRTGGMQDRTDAVKISCWRGLMQDRSNADQDIYSTGRIHDRKDAGQAMLRSRHFFGRFLHRLRKSKVPEPTPAPTKLGRL